MTDPHNKKPNPPLSPEQQEKLLAVPFDELTKHFPNHGRRWLRAKRRELKTERLDGLTVKGTSTLYDENGNQILQWIKKDTTKQQRLDALLKGLETLAEKWRGAVPRIDYKGGLSTSDLLTVYPMGDPHIGLYVWAEEAGTGFDLEKAEANLCGAVDRLVSLAPASEQALIVNLGDFFHTDNYDGRTRRGGNVLDTSGRWPEILRCGVRTMKRCIDKALEKHRRVWVINEIGNHDDHTSIVLSAVLREAYSDNPRVEIDTSPAPYHYFRFGRVLIGVTHGNHCKADQLGPIMATDRAQDWGETKHRYWLAGHIHHFTGREFPGCIVETFRTLAPRDAWHNASGYRSGRDMKCIVMHREHGEIMRHTVEAGMLV